jgi:hypothetical protein
MTAPIITKQQLNIDLQYFINNKDAIGVVVYAIIKGERTPLRMDIEASAQSGLKTLFWIR